MPELPEVETTVKSLNILKNKKVINVDIHQWKADTKKPHHFICTDNCLQI